jgi:hypothetical protein
MAPCESCPPHCAQCAWDQKQSVKPVNPLVVIRTSAAYGCTKKNAAVVVDTSRRQAFMRIGENLHPLSAKFGSILAGTKLEKDIAAAVAA